MLVRSNDVVRLKVEQENVDKNPLSICQGRSVWDKKNEIKRLVRRLQYRCKYKHIHTDAENEWRKESGNETRMRAHIKKVVTVYFLLTLAFAISCSRLYFLFLYFSLLFLLFISSLNVKCMTTYLLLYVTKKNSHLLMLSALVVIVIDDVITLFRCVGCDIAFPQECRRSGLNEGTIRKCRLDDDDVDKDDSWSISASNDMMIACIVLFFLYRQVKAWNV